MTANLTKTYLRHKSPNLLNYDIKTREKNLFNDLIIKVDNRIILDNQRVLASSSLFFEILFKTEVNEIQKSTVTLKTLNFEIMKTLVDFICDGKISNKSHKSIMFKLFKNAIVSAGGSPTKLFSNHDRFQWSSNLNSKKITILVQVK